ncbi:MAG TPA: RsmE family RNA methyltransferase [Pontiella sp.]
MACAVHSLGMNLILLQSDEVNDGVAILRDERAVHIRKVLKASQGKELRIGLLNGPLGTGRVQRVDATLVELSCTFDEMVPPRPCIDLLLAMPRPKVLKRMWAQLAALGVGKIVLVRAEKVERYYFDSHVIESEFFNKKFIEGLQQARCTHLPKVQVEPLFKPFIEDRLEKEFSGHLKLLSDPSGECRIGRLEVPKKNERVLLAIGPEGGWTPYELEMLKERGFNLVSMGSRILRTDTATIALLSILSESIPS